MILYLWFWKRSEVLRFAHLQILQEKWHSLDTVIIYIYAIYVCTVYKLIKAFFAADSVGKWPFLVALGRPSPCDLVFRRLPSYSLGSLEICLACNMNPSLESWRTVSDKWYIAIYKSTLLPCELTKMQHWLWFLKNMVENQQKRVPKNL